MAAAPAPKKKEGPAPGERPPRPEVFGVFQKGDAARTIEMVTADPTLVRARDELQKTLLHWAAWQGNAALAALLLDKGAEVDAADEDGMTPLHWASAHGHPKVVRMLLDKGADVNAKATSHQLKGTTPLHEVAKGKKSPDHIACAKMLIKAGADLNATNAQGQTPLYKAQIFHRKGIIEVLQEAGAGM